MKIVSVVFALAIALAATALAQVRPDFSGVWKLDTAASSAAGGGRGRGTGPGRGQGGGLALGPAPTELTIRQDAVALKVDARMGASTAHLVYKLDGLESRNTMLVGGEAAQVDAVFASVWDAATLVTTMTLRPKDAPVLEYREVRSLAADGTLVVEITRRDLAGNVRRSVYRK